MTASDANVIIITLQVQGEVASLLPKDYTFSPRNGNECQYELILFGHQLHPLSSSTHFWPSMQYHKLFPQHNL
jgi:hypothetical protein